MQTKKCQACHKEINPEILKHKPWVKTCPKCHNEKAPFNHLNLKLNEHKVQVMF